MPDARRPCQELVGALPGDREPGQVALHVRGEHGDAVRGDLLGEELQRAGLPRARRAGDQAVPVQHAERDADLDVGQGVTVDQGAEFQRRPGDRVAVPDGRDRVRSERPDGRLGVGRRHCLRTRGDRVRRRGDRLGQCRGEFLGASSCFVREASCLVRRCPRCLGRCPCLVHRVAHALSLGTPPTPRYDLWRSRPTDLSATAPAPSAVVRRTTAAGSRPPPSRP